jgi:hypothetical protein
MDDVDAELDGDDELTTYLIHKDKCEKCREEPSYSQLKKKGRKKAGERERLEELGGLVRW